MLEEKRRAVLQYKKFLVNFLYFNITVASGKSNFCHWQVKQLYNHNRHRAPRLDPKKNLKESLKQRLPNVPSTWATFDNFSNFSSY